MSKAHVRVEKVCDERYKANDFLDHLRAIGGVEGGMEFRDDDERWIVHGYLYGVEVVELEDY